MTSDSDADLREQFQVLRESDHAAVPAFESILSRAPGRTLRGGRGLAWAAGGALVVVVVAAAEMFLMLQRPTVEPDAVALPAWRSPTDFLLADAAGSVQRLSWTPSPISGLGQPSFNSEQEKR
jgi:hypothetical protein